MNEKKVTVKAISRKDDLLKIVAEEREKVRNSYPHLFCMFFDYCVGCQRKSAIIIDCYRSIQFDILPGWSLSDSHQRI